MATLRCATERPAWRRCDHASNARWQYRPSCRAHRFGPNLDANLSQALSDREDAVFTADQARRAPWPSVSGCGPLAEAVLELQRLSGGNMRRMQGVRTCHAVFIGDSHTLQAFDAARCDLLGRVEASEAQQSRGAENGSRDLVTTSKLLAQRLVQDTAEAFEPLRLRPTNVSQQYVGGLHLPIWLRDRPSRGGEDDGRWALMLSHIHRTRRGGEGELDVFDSSIFGAIARRLGGCLLVLYNEGMHTHDGTPEASALPANVDFALNSMKRAAKHAAPGATFLAWEVVA